VAHPEQDARDGEARGWLVRRNLLLRPSEKMKSTTALRVATARFPVQEEQVEGGEDDSDHAGARGGPIRRRWPEAVRARVSSWGGIRRREKKLRASTPFIWC
jgi:hypothetical protein